MSTALPAENVRHVIGRVRRAETAKAATGYMSYRFRLEGHWSYAYSESETWWLVYLTPFEGRRDDASGLLCEALHAFVAGRKSMVD